MKIRNGFVSNSSSSSFIIAIKQTNIPCPHCGRSDPNFLDMIDKSGIYIDDNHVETRYTEETLARIEDNTKTYMEDKERKELENAIAKYRNNKDWEIAEISLSNHDIELKEIMNNMISSGNAEILWRSEE